MANSLEGAAPAARVGATRHGVVFVLKGRQREGIGCDDDLHNLEAGTGHGQQSARDRDTEAAGVHLRKTLRQLERERHGSSPPRQGYGAHKKRAPASTYGRFAGRPADVATKVAVSPVL